MRRRGWTLHEMLISLTIMSGVIAIAAQVAVGHLRFFRGLGELAALRGQVGQASAIAAGILWSASPTGGDLVSTLDSAIELHAYVGTAVTCASSPGLVVIPAATSEPGNALSAVAAPLEAGDRMIALFADSLGATWLTMHLADAPRSEGSCASVPLAWTLALRESMLVPSGAPVRFTRPLRLSLYRASDARWYLGAREWNESAQRFNIIQPVAGPLEPYDADAVKTGLLFVYRDFDGNVLDPPFDGERVATITIITRGATTRPVRIAGLARAAGERFADSTAVVVSLRNAR